MPMRSNLTVLATACSLVFACVSAHAAEETRSLEELRNTVVNLLEALVQKGVMTREQAQSMVANAQTKAAEEAKAAAAQDAAEQGAVRVTYVPEIVKQQIRQQVKDELRGEVTKDVVAQARDEQWGVPGALPSWVSRFTFSGDIRLRGEDDLFATGNATNTYLDFLTVNSRGGVGKAGDAALLNVTEDRLRERLRLRLGIDALLTNGVHAGVRLSSGNTTDPVSTNQTLGQTGARYQTVIDQAYLRFDANPNAQLPWMTVWAGRTPNPWVSTDLVWDLDLNFEGVAGSWRYGFGGKGETPSNVFLTLGAFPLQEVELSSKDKWLYGAQLGVDLPWSGGGRARVAAAYYYFDNFTGVRNAPDSTLTDYTAPKWIQKGNTLFDIRNDTDPTTNLYALAADYHLLDVVAAAELPVFGYKLLVTGDYVRNLGFDQAKVFALTGSVVDKRVNGYQVEVGFGSSQTGRRSDWRAYWTYRYLERDAVFDGFTDSDFHLGGTDAKGYILRGDWWFRDRTWVSLRYMTSNEIDGPPLGIDTIMLDINGQF